MHTHTLTFRHWEKGEVSRPVRRYGRYWEHVDSHLLYYIGPWTGEVFTAGHVGRISAFLPIGTAADLQEVPA